MILYQFINFLKRIFDFPPLALIPLSISNRRSDSFLAQGSSPSRPPLDFA